MKQAIYLSLLSLLLFFINNEEVLATRVKRSPFNSKMKQLPFSSDDSRTNPITFCNKFTGNCIPTIRPADKVDIAADAEAIHKAIKGLGMKGSRIIEILGKRGIVQRLKIAETYSEKKHGNLLNDLRFDSDGKFEDTLTAFMTPLAIYFAKEIEKTLKEEGTDEKTLVEMLWTIRDPAIKGVMEFYERLFDYKKLADGLKADTKGNFQTLTLKILEGMREDMAFKTRATQDAEALHKTAKTWGKDPTALNNILATRPFMELVDMFTQYKKVSGHEFEDDIKTAFPSEPGMIAIVKVLKDRPKFFAERLNESLNPKVKDRELIRVIVSRSEMDLGAIKDAYKTLYGKTLDSVVGSKVGSNYKNILLTLINGNSSGGGPPPPPPGPPPPKPGK